MTHSKPPPLLQEVCTSVVSTRSITIIDGPTRRLLITAVRQVLSRVGRSPVPQQDPLTASWADAWSAAAPICGRVELSRIFGREPAGFFAFVCVRMMGRYPRTTSVREGLVATGQLLHQTDGRAGPRSGWVVE